MARRMTPEAAKARMRSLIVQGGLPEPDEIVHDPLHDELNLIWHEKKLVVIIELTEREEAIDAAA